MNSPAPGHPPVGHPTPETVDPQIPEQFQKVAANIRKIIMGKDEVIARLLWAVAARARPPPRRAGRRQDDARDGIAASVDGTFKRIQFTPDLLPLDITGTNIFNLRTKTFEFSLGPSSRTSLLADEINRATPKTQSALLEVDGRTPGHRRRHDPRARAAVPRHRDDEPARRRRHVSRSPPRSSIAS